MNVYHFGIYTICLADERGKDETSLPEKIISSPNADHVSSVFSIRVFSDNEEIYAVSLHGIGGGTTVHARSASISGGMFLVLCGDAVFCISLPGLEMNWLLKADPVTCFQIFPYKDEFIIHGEIYISRINIKGEMVWQFGGKDIFVNPDGRAEEIVLQRDFIDLVDFGGNKYRLSYDGRQL